MFLICNESGVNGCFWGDVFLNLLAIGAFCAIVLLIWKGLCWLDSWQWGKKHQRETDSDSRYSVLKEMTETLAMLNQSIKDQDWNTVSTSKKRLEIRGSLKIIRQLTDMCFSPEKIVKIVDDMAIVKIMVSYSNLYSLLQNIVSAKSKETLPKENDIQQSYISLLIEHETLLKGIKVIDNKEKEKKIKEWLNNKNTTAIQKQLNEYITNIDKCIEDINKDNNNEQTQQ